jgi:hypothetical protein
MDVPLLTGVLADCAAKVKRKLLNDQTRVAHRSSGVSEKKMGLGPKNQSGFLRICW